jgi:hypothetical protein
LELTVDSAVTESIAVAGTPPSDEKANERSDPGANRDSLVGMLMHGIIGGSRSLDGLVADTARDGLGAIQGGGETLAGFTDFFSGRIRCRRHQGARVFDKRPHVIGSCVSMFFHDLVLFLFIFAFRCCFVCSGLV